jgi:hypothetical protein
LRRILLVLAVAAMMVAMAAPSAVADHRATHDPADPNPADAGQWCFGDEGFFCFTSRADCEDARLEMESAGPCEQQVIN